MYNKSIKKVILVLTILCVFATVINVIVSYLYPKYMLYKINNGLYETNSSSVIGTADGPANILVSSSSSPYLITKFLLILSICGIVYYIITKNKKDSKADT